MFTKWTFANLNSRSSTDHYPIWLICSHHFPEDQRHLLASDNTYCLAVSSFARWGSRLRQKVVDGQLRLFRKFPLPDTRVLLLWIVEHSIKDNQIVEAMHFYEEYDAS
jgi:hypothetical protein